MSPFRTQLRFARHAYRAARYPGDLCAELLPKPGRGERGGSRRWLLIGGLATSASAAAVMLSLLVSRVSDLPRTWPVDPSQRALVDWLPVRPDEFSLPKFQPGSMPDLQLQTPPAQRYRGFALPYPKLKVAAPVNWLRRVWDSVESA